MAFYLWIKVLHILAVISWMAGLLYLPRLFVNHVEQAKGKPELEAVFQMMERKLLRVIMNPAMIVVWICGLLMAFLGGAAIYASVWFALKFFFVSLMTLYHHWLGRERKRLLAGEYQHEGRYYRLMNEVPTLLMVFIVILVIIKPFS